MLPALIYGYQYEFAKPSYDSGWVAFAQNEIKILTHNLGGNINDYVVDMQFRDDGANKVNQIYFGSRDADSVGTYWSNLTASTIRVDRCSSDVNCEEIRVRIWKIERANFDSGWKNISPGQIFDLTHNIGGSSDDYVVYLEFKDNESYGIHQRIYGGSVYEPASSAPVSVGAYWRNLNNSTVRVTRGPEDTTADQIRIRIWKANHPDYDSGWQSPGAETAFNHNLGGPWNDYVVDLQFKDIEDHGVNQMFYGGGPSAYEAGAYWKGLSGSQVSVYRQSSAPHIDQVRVRIWRCSAPKYDSGWFSLSPKFSQTLTHDLGGNPNDYVVDLQFKDSVFSINNRYYGGRRCYDGSPYTQYRGAHWYALNNSQITVYRFESDAMADQVRVRLWLAPSADFDSGWQTVPAPGSMSFNPGLSSEDDCVVYLEFKNSAGGVHHTDYGGDKWWDNSDVLYFYGACWDSLTPTKITVQRLGNDTVVNQFRVRIWKNDPAPVPRYAWKDDWRSYEPAVPSVRTHDLGGNVDDYVLDMRFRTSAPFYQNHRSYGSIYAKNEKSGAHYQNLNTTSLEVVRALNDGFAAQIMLRIWNTGYVEKTIYVTGHITVGGIPLSGVTLTFSGTGGGTCFTDAGGNYSMSLPYNYTGTATPSLAGHVFTPASSNYNSLKANTQTDYSAATVMLITITSPLGGAVWNAGVANSLAWTTIGPVGNLKIELLKGANLASIVVLYTSNDGLESWTPSLTLTAGSDYQIKITDFSNAAVTATSSNFTIVNNNPIDSNFQHSSSWTGAGHGTDGWYVGDINGDFKDDIFRYVPGVSGAQVFLSDGTKFVPAGSWTGAGHGTDGWYVGDFNGDSKDDIFRYLPGTSGADVFLSNGTKFIYSGSWTGAGHGTDGWYVGDFNGDSKDDIFRYVPGTSGADVFLSNGTKFIYSGSWTGAGHGTDGWYVGDFNGDGRDDIFRYMPGVSGAQAFLSNGTKFVLSGSWTGAGHGADGWYVGDFNGDGRDDIFRYMPGISGADVFLSNGTKFIYSGSWTGAGHGTDGWYVGDYNGDAKDDIFRYIAGVSGADVYLADCTMASSSTITSDGLHTLLDEDMIEDLQGTRATELTYLEEEELLSPFIRRLLTGDVPSIFEIKQVYEEAVGRRVPKAAINQLLFRHHYWSLVEQQRETR
jgi:hypothetical protein